MESQDSSQDRGPKPLCLNTLSSSVMNIIRQKQTTTFQEVAEIVLKSWDPYENGNDKTTRRRVYDVLNVFLAAGLITKDNKSISYNAEACSSTGPKLSQEDEELYQSCDVLQKQLANKVKTYLQYKALLERNRLNGARPASSVQLPAIFICFDNDKGESASSLDGKTLEISSDQDPIFFSPMNVLENSDIGFQRQRDFLRSQPQLSFLEHAIFDEDIKKTSKHPENQPLPIPRIDIKSAPMPNI